MPRLKTFLTPEEQWIRTIRYMNFVQHQYVMETSGTSHKHGPRDGCSFIDDELAPMHGLLWVVKTPNHLLNLGDILVVSCSNGMVQRYGMSGVSSKGARLDNYYIPLCSNSGDVVLLPGDLIGLRCDDPAVGRFVADLRASSRCRVGASIPAPKHRRLSGHPIQGLRFDGCYRARREPRDKRTEFFDRYLRFFRDGTVISGRDMGFSLAHLSRFTKPWDTSGSFTVQGNSISFAILLNGEVIERYEGKIDGKHLRLSRYCHPDWGQSRDDAIYKFGPWRD